MSITLTVVLKDGEADVESKILEAVRVVLDKGLRSSAPAIRTRIQDLTDALITRTSEYKSLLSGDLLGELGIPAVENRLRQILATIKESIQVKAEPVKVQGRNLTGGISASMLRSSMEDILALPAASYISHGRDGDYHIPWLDWLVVQGDRIMVFGYDVTFRLNAAARAKSRSGLAIMIPWRGHGWRVPPQFSGTPENNFLTRAFNGREVADLIGRIMEQEIQKRLER